MCLARSKHLPRTREVFSPVYAPATCDVQWIGTWLELCHTLLRTWSRSFVCDRLVVECPLSLSRSLTFFSGKGFAARSGAGTAPVALHVEIPSLRIFYKFGKLRWALPKNLTASFFALPRIGGSREGRKHWWVQNAGLKLVVGKINFRAKKIGGSRKVNWWVRNFCPEFVSLTSRSCYSERSF